MDIRANEHSRAECHVACSEAKSAQAAGKVERQKISPRYFIGYDLKGEVDMIVGKVEGTEITRWNVVCRIHMPVGVGEQGRLQVRDESGQWRVRPMMMPGIEGFDSQIGKEGPGQMALTMALPGLYDPASEIQGHRMKRVMNDNDVSGYGNAPAGAQEMFNSYFS